jgi:hypothetical protein
MKPETAGGSQRGHSLEMSAPAKGGGSERFVIVCLFVVIIITQPGCAGIKQRAPARKKAAAARIQKREPILIGVITLVNSDGGFVLIDSGTNPPPNSNAILKSKTAGVESAELKVSEIRRHPFVIADIVEGAPVKGDLVYQ